MRQAGRFDPEYRRIRNQCKLPLEELFCEPELAARISLLPKRFGVDAIIFFQDILTPLAPMGARFLFRPGPVLEAPVRSADHIESLRPFDVARELPFVPKTLRLVRESLAGELPLLGFAGAPLTLAFFLTDGGSPDADGGKVRTLMRESPALLHRLLDRLTDMTVDYLRLQIESGVDAVQLFESMADRISRTEYEAFAHPYHTRIFAELGPQAPRILFAKDHTAVDLMADSGADVCSFSDCVDLAEAKRKYGHRVAFQGNVDNRLLVDGAPEEIDTAVRQCLAAGNHEGHILNLSHGLLKDTPVENVRRFIETGKQTVPSLTNVA
jgi:uroporphyrinogen decarboxylase